MKWWSKRARPNPPPPYSMTPIPVGPFEDAAERDAALGAAVLHVTFKVTGAWPPIDAVVSSVRALTEQVAR